MMWEIWDLMMFREGPMGAIVSWFMVIVIAALPILFVGAVRQQMEWNAYTAEHCRIIGKMSGSTGVGPAIGGKGGGVAVTVTPGKTGYQCDDGMMYWR